MTEYMDILTAGGVVTVDVTATIESGNLDESECETTSHVFDAVKRAVRDGYALDTPSGGRVLFLPDAPLAYTHRVED